MESYILLSELNDYLFCPRSIYFHHIYGRYDKSMYQGVPQVAGTLAHRSIDTQSYSTKSSILLSMPVYSEKYGIAGVIDMFDTTTGTLTERKKFIKAVYPGNKLQLIGQYLCLKEMGYDVKILRFHSKDDNKNYPIEIPNLEDILFFEQTLESFSKFQLHEEFTPNFNKCEKCIYRNLCDKSPL